MNWFSLYHDFLNGKPDAVQAMFSVLGFALGTIGTLVVLSTFKRQRLINKQQLELNRLLLEENRRQIRPRFKINYRKTEAGEYKILLSLKNAFATHVTFYHSNYGIEDLVSVFEMWDVDIHEYEIYQDKFEKTLERNLILQVFFKDEDGRNYTQEISTQNYYVFTSLPELLRPGYSFPKQNSPIDYVQI